MLESDIDGCTAFDHTLRKPGRQANVGIGTDTRADSLPCRPLFWTAVQGTEGPEQTHFRHKWTSAHRHPPTKHETKRTSETARCGSDDRKMHLSSGWKGGARRVGREAAKQRELHLAEREAEAHTQERNGSGYGWTGVGWRLQPCVCTNTIISVQDTGARRMGKEQPGSNRGKR